MKSFKQIQQYASWKSLLENYFPVGLSPLTVVYTATGKDLCLKIHVVKDSDTKFSIHGFKDDQPTEIKGSASTEQEARMLADLLKKEYDSTIAAHGDDQIGLDHVVSEAINSLMSEEIAMLSPWNDEDVDDAEESADIDVPVVKNLSVTAYLTRIKNIINGKLFVRDFGGGFDMALLTAAISKAYSANAKNPGSSFNVSIDTKAKDNNTRIGNIVISTGSTNLQQVFENQISGGTYSGPNSNILTFVFSSTDRLEALLSKP